MESCIFCKIAKGEIPSFKVYEDSDFLAFLDNDPAVIGHVLLIPKQHSKWVWDLAEDKYLELMNRAKTVAMALRKTFDTEFVAECIIGTDVDHVHIHILPRQLGDGLDPLPKQRISPRPADEEFKKIAEKIRGNI